MRRLLAAALLAVTAPVWIDAAPAGADGPVVVEGPPGSSVVAAAPAPGGGTWLLGADGGIYAVGGAPFLGAATGARPGVAAVDVAATPSGLGLWVAFADGWVVPIGDAAGHGHAVGLGEPIAAIVSHPSGSGYWLVGRRGGVFSFGDAPFHGSASSLRLGGVIVDAIGTRSGGGYWLVDTGGGIYAFGDARFHGSLPGLGIRTTVVAAAASPSGEGYWLLGRDGGVFAFGDAEFRGAVTGRDRPAVAIAAGADGRYAVALGRAAPVPAAGAVAPPAGSGSGRRVVYANRAQRVWLVEADGTVTRSFPVSGRAGVPGPGTYTVFSQSRFTTGARDRGITMEYMTRFTRSRSGTNIGFHSIPFNRGVPMQSEAQLGTFQSAGCVRLAPADAAFLYAWAPVGTTVVVTP